MDACLGVIAEQWGSDRDFSLVERGYEELRGMVDRLWPERFAGRAEIAS